MGISRFILITLKIEFLCIIITHMHVTKSDRSRKVEAKIEENLFFAGAKAQDRIWRCEK